MAKDGKLTIYGVPPSPPSNMVWMCLDIAGIKYEKYEPNLLFKENKKEWYKKINPNGAVPAMKDVDGFCQNEGIAISRYLIEASKVNTPIYPYADAAKVAKINEAIEFVCEDLREN
jgi:glutathione S-transferase